MKPPDILFNQFITLKIIFALVNVTFLVRNTIRVKKNTHGLDFLNILFMEIRDKIWDNNLQILTIIF